ncbi:Tigger transposable element-derived protein 4 [Araneus ventricosus]|uniref:Tigger transposable element-derived protein 4 n=1 Tax=Araneus ventricosus TaxID=182803 RepID=A0A4Y2N2N2_ARAVE|nr:Tigger transposable element-derived protein 4 [Araneus ventricosus]
MDLNIEFKASNGWLENFTKKQNIVFRKLCSESAWVDASSCEVWLSELPSLLKDYKADDVFNADENGLFFQCLPNKTAAFKGEECHGGKQSKLRVTVLLAANQSGKEKLPPLKIGRSKKLRCFAKISHFQGYTSQIKRLG